jgi:hypothetical protein
MASQAIEPAITAVIEVETTAQRPSVVERAAAAERVGALPIGCESLERRCAATLHGCSCR